MPVEPLQQGVVCGPEISVVRRQLSTEADGDQQARALLQGYTPQTCYEVRTMHVCVSSLFLPSHINNTNTRHQACLARLGPSPGGFIINLYYENGQQVCTCCRNCEGVRFVPR